MSNINIYGMKDSAGNTLRFSNEGSGSGGHTIKDSTTTFTQRDNLKFTGAVSVSDDSSGNATVVNISGGGGGTSNPLVATYEEATALHNHEVGEYVYFNSIIYKVTSAITAGGTIAVGTNVALDPNLTGGEQFCIEGIPEDLGNNYVEYTVLNDTWRKCAQELYALIDKDKITQNAMLVRIDSATGNKSYYRPVFVNASAITCSLMWLSTPNRLLSDVVQLDSTGYRFSGEGTTITDNSTGTASMTLRFYYSVGGSSGGSSSADDISYDNTSSGLSATNVQDAVDEVNSNLEWKLIGTVTGNNSIPIDTEAYKEFYVVQSFVDNGMPRLLSYNLLSAMLSTTASKMYNGWFHSSSSCKSSILVTDSTVTNDGFSYEGSDRIASTTMKVYGR